MNGTGEQTPLLETGNVGQTGRPPTLGDDANSVVDRYVSQGEQKLAETYVGERLPYSDYSSIDFLHDLVRIYHLCGCVLSD